MTEDNSLEFELKSNKFEEGFNWLIVSLKNNNANALIDVKVFLKSNDSSPILVHEEDFAHLHRIEPGQTKSVSFQIKVYSEREAYLEVQARQGADDFEWKSPPFTLYPIVN